MFSRSSTRTSYSPLHRKQSRFSPIAAGAATAGVITAGTAIAAVAAFGNVAQTGASGTSGHSAATAFDAVGVLNTASHDFTSVAAPTTDGHATLGQRAALHSASTGGSTSPHAAAKSKTVAEPKQAAKAVPQPYNLYDSVMPSSLPAGEPAAVYANGSYATSPSQVAGHKSVLWIDTNGSDPNANVLDVEPGDATPYVAAQWIQAKLSADPHAMAIIYTMISDWGQVKDTVAALPTWMQQHTQYWIADPTGYPHIVPGSSATQWYWGSYSDQSMANGNFDQ